MQTTLTLVRYALLAILAVGLAGTGVEFFLLKHTEGVWQLVPVVLVAVGLGATVWCLVAPNPVSIRTLQAIMALFLVSGIAGFILHYIGNVSYERESDPSISGAELYRRAFTGSTPSLAPGTMIQLGLVGLLFTFRHPRLGRKSVVEAQPQDRTTT